MSLASVAAQQTTPAQGAAAGSAASSSAMNSLDTNFTDFLNMLMTQLKNQDPTSPMDANQFTTELVQFSSVEQQIQTNQGLTQLIQLTQGSEVMQSSGMIGKQVTVQSSQIPLQNGHGTVTITTPAAEPVSIAISNATGTVIRNATLNAAAGANDWSWDGKDDAGHSVTDGAYKLVATATAANGTGTSLPFTVTGTATGVASSNNAVQLQLGPLTVPFTAVTSVGG
jgi:flagellar basal-body rod modification protein FlgD